jgi:hypothetical protein
LAAVRGRAGDTPGSEAALLQAKLLAPNYSRVQWALGNFLLREGREDEAYVELMKAVTGDPTLAPMAAATSLQMSDGDVAIVSSRFQNSPAINVALALQLAGSKRFDEALKLWRRTDTAGEQFAEAAKQIRNQLIENKKFNAAVSMKGSSEIGQGPGVGRITNPGFEEPIRTEGVDVFEWKVTRGTYPQIGVTDAQKLTGKYSLVLLLSGPDPKEFRGPSQVIAVRSGSHYELTVPYRSDVRSASSFQWEVVSGTDGRRLTISQPMEASSEWTKTVAQFLVPPDTDGVEIRLVRSECIGTKCTATGSFWFDDLSLNAK